MRACFSSSGLWVNGLVHLSSVNLSKKQRDDYGYGYGYGYGYEKRLCQELTNKGMPYATYQMAPKRLYWTTQSYTVGLDLPGLERQANGLGGVRARPLQIRSATSGTAMALHMRSSASHSQRVLQLLMGGLIPT